MNKEIFWNQFPLGTHLCREPMPNMAEMKQDMEIIRKKGFNLIKLQENWMLDEPVEGNVDFSKYHELIEYANRLDMGVYLGLTCEQAPNWLWEKHPGCAMELRDGRKVAFHAQSTLRADGKPGPCYDHSGAMADQLRFIKTLVTELGKHENIVVWNTWQEIGYWAESFAGGHVCYCPNTLGFFREWLAELYGGDIEQLNQHWNVRYASFESVEPDRCEQVVCIPQQFYFHYFMDNVQIPRILRARYEAIKAADPLKRPVFAHKGAMAISSGADWTYARCQDFFGVSNYPAWGCGHAWDDHRQGKRLERHEALLAEMWDGLALKIDYLRSASKEGAPIWAAEFQGGPVSTDFHIGRVPGAEDMRRWMLTTLGAGATAISFWITRAEIMAPETNGFALLDSEGDTTERLDEAARIGSVLGQYPLLFSRGRKPQAAAAILVDEWKYQLLQRMNFAGEAYWYDLRGWYKILWDSGVSCDFIEASQLSEERTKKYKTIIVPMPLSMSNTVAEKILAQANAGVNIILEGGCGRLNETGFAVRGQINPLIREALGVTVDRLAMVREPAEDDRWSQRERAWGEYEEAGFIEGSGSLGGSNIRGNVFIETYKIVPPDVTVCFKWDSKAAGLVKSLGKGKIWLLGTAVGPGMTAYIDAGSTRGIRTLLNACGVMPEHEGTLRIQKRIFENQQAWFITNPAREAVTEKIILPEGLSVKDMLAPSGSWNTAAGAITVTVDPLDVQLLILQ
jgi:beta-galactosidase